MSELRAKADIKKDRRLPQYSLVFNAIRNQRSADKMESYADVNDDSGIAGFEIGDNFTRVKFKDGSIYHYTYVKPGKNHVDHTRSLATSGGGLNSYINNYVRKGYEVREE